MTASDEGGTLRLFVALPVPDHVRVLATAAVAPARDLAPDLTWTRPDGWHVTLAYVGDVPAAAEPAIARAVADAAAATAPIDLRLGAAGRFGRHALWLAVRDDPAGAVAALGVAVQAALLADGLPVDERPVRPHLTLARGARGRGAAVDDRVVDAFESVEVGWSADAVDLVASVRGDGPARYPTRSTWPLLGA